MTPLAITGLGVVAPTGTGREAFFDALARPIGEPFSAPTLFDASEYDGARVAEVRDFDPTPSLGDKGLRNLDRLTKLFLVASRAALEDAGIKRDGQFVVYAPATAGVCASTAYGSLEAIMELNRVAVLENPRYLNPSKFPNTVINSALGYVSIWDDLRALNATVCNGNCGALDAVLLAETYLESGRADVITVGGGEALHEALFMAFDNLGSLAPSARVHTPGVPGSEGMRLGEGSVLVTLEREKAARERGARVLGLLTGYGTGFEPPERESELVHVAPEAIARAVRAALADAQMAPDDVDLVASCANGVALYDAGEREGLDRALGDRVPVAAPKARFGETLGASGAFSMAAALGWLGGVKASPMVRGEAPANPRSVLVTAMGFYGNASAVVLRAG